MRERIAQIAREWIGTPFYPHAQIKCKGADCVSLALAIYIEAGLLPPNTKLPKYHLSTGLHLERSMVIDWLSTCPAVRKEDSPDIGSVITLNVAKVDHHVGVMITKTSFVHAIRKCGVIETSLGDSAWLARFRTSWGPILCDTKITGW